MPKSKARRALAIFGALAIAIPAAGFAGCGEEDAQDAVDDAREQIDEAAEDAQEQADQLQEDIEEQIDEATNDDASTTTTEDSGGDYAP